MKFDKEENEILQALDDGDIRLSEPSVLEIERIKETAHNTVKKNKRVTLRLYEHDFIGIQKKALELGIPYQTLISSIIHRYVEGGLSSGPSGK